MTAGAPAIQPGNSGGNPVCAVLLAISLTLFIALTKKPTKVGFDIDVMA